MTREWRVEARFIGQGDWSVYSAPKLSESEARTMSADLGTLPKAEARIAFREVGEWVPLPNRMLDELADKIGRELAEAFRTVAVSKEGRDAIRAIEDMEPSEWRDVLASAAQPIANYLGREVW
jgi:hypothetical protein